MNYNYNWWPLNQQKTSPTGVLDILDSILITKKEVYYQIEVTIIEPFTKDYI